MNTYSGKLSTVTIIIFAIALVLFVYIFRKDIEATKDEDRNIEDKTWIYIFLSILIIGVLSSIFLWVKSNYNINTTNNGFLNFGKKIMNDKFKQLPKFVGRPHF